MSETLTKVVQVLTRIFEESDLGDFLDLTHSDYGVVVVFGRRLILTEAELSGLSLKGSGDEPLPELYKDRLFVFDSLDAASDAAMRRRGISFCDGEGNLNLALGSMTMEAHGILREPQPKNNLMTETSLKILLALLSSDDLVSRPMREIADCSAVSVGSVQRTVEALKENRFIFVTPRGRFLKNKRALLDMWVRGFNMLIKPKCRLGLAMMRPGAPVGSLPEGVCWGGEQAAHLRDGYLVAGEYSVFTSMGYRDTCAGCGFLPVPGGNVAVYRKFWAESLDCGNVAPDLVIYAELMGTGDSRCAEAASRLIDHEKYAD